jgi:hypothetical protein
MFDFRKEVIINKATLPAEDGGLDRVTNDGTYLKVLRCADYEIAKITNLVHVAPKAGSPAKAQLGVQSEPCQVVIKIGLDNTRMHGEYANDWAKLEKTLIFEAASGTVADQVAALKEVIKANPIVSVTDGGVITCKDVHQIIKSVEVFDEEGALLTSFDKADTIAAGNIVVGERPVNTGELLTENLRFPSYPNLRYAAEHEEERPIEGELYDLYVFDYVVPRVGLHGQGAVGQQITSATTHAFYVRKGIYTSENNPFEKITGKGDEVPVAGE